MTDTTPIDPGRLNRYMDEFAVEILKKYFTSGEFTGGRFETFAGGGDHPDVANRITIEDIVATSLIGSRFPGRATLAILEEHGDEYSALLGQIPVDVDLWDAPDDMVGDDSPAGQLWAALSDLPGVGPMAASKLLARKRPRLVPVFDRVLRNSLDRAPTDWWLPLRRVLIDKVGLVNAISDLRDQSGLADISLLRILHVCIWMREFGRPESAPDAES